MKRWMGVCAVGLAMLLVACADGGAADMSPSAVSRLDAAVADVRDAVEANDDETAREHLTSLRMTVADLVVSNAITADRAVEINTAIARLEAELVARAVPATTSAPTTTTRPTTTTSTTTTTTTTEAPRGSGKNKNSDD